MPFFNWALLKSRILHPDIGIPADDSQGLPYLSGFNVSPYQNYGLSVKAQSGTNSLTGFLFISSRRYILGSGEVKAIDYIGGYDASSMFTIDSLRGHVFATTASGIINNSINISGNRLGWSGGQWAGVLSCNPQITFFNYSGSNYVGFGNAYDGTFAIFKPGGIVNTYNGYNADECLQPCNFYNGLYTVLYNPDGYGYQYGFISLADAPEILPVFATSNIIPYSFTESALLLSTNNGDTYGYDGINDPTLTSSFIKLGYTLNSGEIFCFDPSAGRLLSISPNIITVGGHAYYPVYVYSSILNYTPQQYARPVKNYTVNGHLNWRKR